MSELVCLGIQTFGECVLLAHVCLCASMVRCCVVFLLIYLLQLDLIAFLCTSASVSAVICVHD